MNPTSINRAVLLLCALLLTRAAATAQHTKRIFREAEEQVGIFYKQVEAGREGARIFPRSLAGQGLLLVPSGDWTSGFWPGILWMMYERTGRSEWKTRAEKYTALMEKEPTNRNSHDVGFKVYNSFGNGYRLSGKEEYKEAVIRGASTLASRFNPKVGCIRSWDFGKWQYPVIIDNMMNLELLFEATRFSGDSSFREIALLHANNTLRNHFREDHSSFHLVDYDTLSGKVIGKMTVQGFSNESAWARGQAWGLYGFTMCYRETGDSSYLRQAERIAGFLLQHPGLPADHIPYWDLNLSDTTGQPRDASAAAIMASALYELAQYSEHRQQYRFAAGKMLNSLIRYYRAPIGSHHGFLLLHSTGHKPVNSEVDTPLIYADYYFLEALKRSESK